MKTFFRILCLNFSRETFEGIRSIVWGRSGLVRLTDAEPNSPEIGRLVQEADQIILDWSAPRIKGALECFPYLPARNVWHFSETDARIPGRIRMRPLSVSQLQKQLTEVAFPEARERILWPNDSLIIEPLQKELETSLPLILEKYLPDRTKSATIHQVTDGWSGTPLIRLSLEDEKQQYFIKFFVSSSEFIQQWDAHKRASEWLPEIVVPLTPIPGLFENGQSQFEAFNVRLARHFPICYESAQITETLKDVYRSRSGAFVQQAYETVLRTLSLHQKYVEHRICLSTLPDCRPFTFNRVQPLFAALRGREYRAFINGSISELSKYGERMTGKHKWRSLLLSLETFLGSDPPPWVSEPCQVTFGKIHGDANSRNFLFESNAVSAEEVQIVDCGAYQDSAPIVFDLAQLESDVKFVLMASDESANGYLDIDTARLARVRAVEAQAVHDGFDFSSPARGDLALRKAYAAVVRIRKRAASVSSGDPDSRAYRFYLLYWSLKKAARTNLSHVKRLLALYSACAICEHMADWKPRRL